MVRRVMVSDFRSYASLDLTVNSRLVVLTGDNGAGKTNLLEALSLFGPGRGLRRADLSDMIREGAPNGFSVSVLLDIGTDQVRLGTGADPATPEMTVTRKARIDGETVSSTTQFADYLRFVWLTPAFDGLFSGSAGDRRRFLDRLVLAVDPKHGARVNALERALRSRNRLLEDERSDPAWLDAVEREVAETGVAVAAARQDTVARLAALITAGRDDASPFPWAMLAIEGPVERELLSHAAIDVEDFYRGQLREYRSRDRAAGRTLIGPHVSDLAVRHGPKNVPAARSSTGEQKALLVGLVLAHAQLVTDMSGIAPLVLLDEIAAHLDPRRRSALFDTLAASGSQVWMTGADREAFRDLPSGAEQFHVHAGTVLPLA